MSTLQRSLLLILIGGTVLFGLLIVIPKEIASQEQKNSYVNLIEYAHLATPEDINHLKGCIGVYDPNKNYTYMTEEGYMTGERPPTEAEWNALIGNLYIQDVPLSLSVPSSM